MPSNTKHITARVSIDKSIPVGDLAAPLRREFEDSSMKQCHNTR
ncbi:predicted protein [Chaetomium globosum CBS 148.51]|uniref:Uncharacterized protein n=1 Tax=Chaetomium globosum (strain ATCC 6205 / CBS 148.51 / DSM 1962 / NBRC 6347 / NRRL 1970) TaxID=306901 RepID=Q2GN51_CHAGB|nr:uncharacterized protein CHGG_10603 [Chaetomium globosum CBS 148.51]EAQ84199.1 predicted protein [Chaetomium globosum CBS 148.51]